MFSCAKFYVIWHISLCISCFSEGKECMNNHSEYFLSACFRTLLSSERDHFQSVSSSREKLLVYAQGTNYYKTGEKDIRRKQPYT